VKLNFQPVSSVGSSEVH